MLLSRFGVGERGTAYDFGFPRATRRSDVSALPPVLVFSLGEVRVEDSGYHPKA